MVLKMIDFPPFLSTEFADTFDSMTEDRVYRKGLSQAVAFEELDEFYNHTKLVELYYT